METNKANSLYDGAMLASLLLCGWSGRVLDRKVTTDVLQSNEAGARAARVYKTLLPGDALKAIETHDTLTRDVHYKNTLPWIRGGADILPAANYMRYTDLMRQRFAERQRLIDRLMETYETEKVEAKRVLGKMFNEQDYPAPEVLRSKFRQDLQFFPIPKAEDFRTGLIEEHSKHLVAELTKAAEAAVGTLAKRLAQMAGELATRFASGDARFKDAFVRNCLEQIAVMENLNFDQNPVVAQALAELKQALSTHTTDTLRSSKAARTDVAAKAAQVASAMGPFMGKGS